MAKSLLLADDSVTIQKVVGISFASEDIEITTVDNGSDAVERAREIRPDIILADVVMPGLSGYEVCEAVKADPDLAHVPVILLTGTFEAFDADRAAQVGAAGHVSKPFEAQTLVDRVKEFLAAAPAAVVSDATQVLPVASKPMDSERSPQAFDLSDDGSELSTPTQSVSMSGEPLEFDESDAAFSFDEESFAASISDAPPPPPVPGDATLVLPTSAPDAEAPVDPRDLARATLLEPGSARGFDVSSSDLGPPDPPHSMQQDPVFAQLEAASQMPPPVEPPIVDAEDADSDEGALFEAASVPTRLETEASNPFEEPEHAQPEPAPLPPPIDAEPLDAMDLEPSMDDGMTGEEVWPRPEPAPHESGATTTPFTMEDPEQEAVLETEPPVAALASASEPTRELAPELRQELSDTLEKIAWDAFGPVTEKIVKQALERIEQVAWEVVPRLAETLIQEEIRRLKDTESD